METSLFIAKTHDFNHDGILDYRHYLNSDELESYNKIKIKQDKNNYITSRKILKSALQKLYPNISRKSWKFTKNSYGKPIIIYPELQKPLYFNISHTLDAVAVAVSQTSDVGVDIEKIRNLAIISFPEMSISHLEISKNYFTKNEYKKISSLPYNDGVSYFWRLWTLKESYMKYRGIGLSLGLDCIEVDISNQSIIIKPNDVETNAYQWVKEDMVISLSLSKKHHSITLFDYDTSITSPTGNNYQYIHN
ncbi:MULTISPECIES: 4'-phosphopantetheinyl transferase family protein [Enterobacterales]|uniref:4'-phosphopantetheinyl transferase family protein n=2 Tax=Gammaproteobacteria TaxID=1236 RepID=UPI0019D22188|nr:MULTISPECIES: 4'-phosphopantetheinyl transferase superfamily protein [Enterobacterales]MBN5218043.1 4'-phosphopantetheinyl transferase superfamily protein [Serratia ureilytica]MCW9528855.1 4'-phosphopantetheinyl transferase superfamily protein [Klebsiella grimontii]